MPIELQGMAQRKRTVPGPDGPVEATVMGFRTPTEHWTEVLLDDGTVIKLKLVVTDVYRIDDQYDDEGNPMYVVRSQNILRVDAPDNLRKN
jgi:hypothetical protein